MFPSFCERSKRSVEWVDWQVQLHKAVHSSSAKSSMEAVSLFTVVILALQGIARNILVLSNTRQWKICT
ncbi:hypothetical protein CJ030_MR2G027127 [Morella rubra]|uniref:Uncharacterized protein n=1 Tax=Morella rubra TaxID=262757 RepID=A0A6A1WFC2_9ROSI|nr:hypothetical protein CJ030_MR2G027127 [Morella rubra]